MPENNSKLYRKINNFTFFRIIEPRVGKSLRRHHVQTHTTLKNPTTSSRWPATDLGAQSLYSRPSGCLGLSDLTEFFFYFWANQRPILLMALNKKSEMLHRVLKGAICHLFNRAPSQKLWSQPWLLSHTLNLSRHPECWLSGGQVCPHVTALPKPSHVKKASLDCFHLDGGSGI